MSVEDPLPISLIAHTVFCERRAWLESVGETVPSIAIEEGVAEHAAVDARKDDRARSRRSVAISSEDLGITGRCDVLDMGEGGITVVEFKSAPLRRRAEVTQAQRVQLALQRHCLEESGQRVASQAIYFTTSRRTVPVELSADDLDEAARAMSGAHAKL